MYDGYGELLYYMNEWAIRNVSVTYLTKGDAYNPLTGQVRVSPCNLYLYMPCTQTPQVTIASWKTPLVGRESRDTAMTPCANIFDPMVQHLQ